MVLHFFLVCYFKIVKVKLTLQSATQLQLSPESLKVGIQGLESVLTSHIPNNSVLFTLGTVVNKNISGLLNDYVNRQGFYKAF